jgi:Cyclic nucleotide-binding domain
MNADFTAASQMLLKILKELAVAQDYERRADDVPLVKLNKQIFRLKAEKLIPRHPLFKLLSLAAIRIIQELCIILQLKENQVIYRQAEPSHERIYICIVGKIALRGYTSLDIFETIGHVTSGDTLGEEGLYEADALRKDSAFAEDDSYLFEFTKDSMIRVKETL